MASANTDSSFWWCSIQTATFGGVLHTQVHCWQMPFELPLEVEVVVGHHKIVLAMFDDLGVELTEAIY